MLSSSRILHVAAGIASIFLFIELFVHEVLPSELQKNSDLSTYLNAARAVRQGVDPYMPVAAWMQHYTGGPLRADYYVYTPIFAILVLPFSLVPLHVAASIWGVCSILWVGGVVVNCLQTAEQRARLWIVLTATAGAILISPVRMELQWGQADILLTFLVSSSLIAAKERHPRIGGLCLAVAAVTKPPILALVIFYVWKRERDLVSAALCSWLLLFFLPFLFLGKQTFGDQLAVWGFWSERYTPFIDNIAPKGVLSRLFSTNLNGPGIFNCPPLVTLLWVILALCLWLTLLLMVERKTVRSSPLAALEFSLVVCTVLITSPLTEWIYLTLLIIPLLLCGLSVLHRPRGGRDRAAGAALAAIYVALCSPLNHIEYHEWPHISEGGLRGALAVLAAAVYLYPLLATYVVCFLMLRHASGSRPLARLHAHAAALAHSRSDLLSGMRRVR